MLLVVVILTLICIGLVVGILVLTVQKQCDKAKPEKIVCFPGQAHETRTGGVPVTIPLTYRDHYLTFNLQFILKNGTLVDGYVVAIDSGSSRPLQVISQTYCDVNAPKGTTCFNSDTCDSVSHAFKKSNSAGTYTQTFRQCNVGHGLTDMTWNGVSWGRVPNIIWLVDENTFGPFPAWVGFGVSSSFLSATDGMGISSFSITGPQLTMTPQLSIPGTPPASPIVVTPWKAIPGHGGRSVEIVAVDGKRLPTPLWVTLDTGNSNMCDLASNDTTGWPANGAFPKTISFGSSSGRTNKLNFPPSTGTIGLYTHAVLGLPFLRSFNWHVDDNTKLVYFSPAE